MTLLLGHLLYGLKVEVYSTIEKLKFSQSPFAVEQHHFDIYTGGKYFGVSSVATEIKVKHPTDSR